MNKNARCGVTNINLNDKSVKVPTMVEIYSTVLYLIIPQHWLCLLFNYSHV